MKYLIVTAITLAIGFNAYAAKIYKCSDATGRLYFQDTPCGKSLKGEQIQTDKDQSQADRKPNLADQVPTRGDNNQKKEALSGGSLDEKIAELLEEPYKIDDEKFIDHVRENNLIGQKDSDGDTVLSVAALNGQVAVIEYLLQNGADVNATNNSGNTIFSFAAKLNDQVKEALILNGANIDHFGHDAQTPLINAVNFQDPDTVNLLISRGAILDHIDNLGGSALFYAASAGNIEIVKSLVEAGAKVNIGTKYSPLKGAAAGNHLKVVAYLISQGASP